MFRPILGAPVPLTEPYPVHDIVGQHAWYGRCPGGSVQMLRDGNVHGREHGRLAEEISAFYERYSEHIREETAARAERLRAVDSDVPEGPGEQWRTGDGDVPESVGRFLREQRQADLPPGMPLGTRPLLADDAYPEGYEYEDDDVATETEVAGFTGTGYSMGAGPDRPVEEFFPGRPADAPEPGPGEPGAVTIAWDEPLSLTSLGKTHVDNARDQLRALLSMAVEQLAQTQDTLARASAQADGAGSLRAAAEQQLIAAEGLVAAAIGSASDLPQAAERLQEQIMVAKQSVADGDGIAGAVALLSDRLQVAHEQLSAAVSAAEEYKAIP
jgi:hypothetical protein